MRKNVLLCVLLLLSSLTLFAETGAELKARIEKATAGQTVIVEQGVYQTTEILVPAGVSIKGAGYDKVTLNVNGDNGLKFKDSNAPYITGITVVGANNSGIALENCVEATIARVVVKDCLTGISLSGGSKNRVAVNAVSGNRTGIMMNSEKNAVVSNCTIYNSNGLGLSVNNTTDSAFFNNLFAVNALAVYVAQNNVNLLMDYNLYWGSLIGKGRDVPAPTLDIWRSLEELDYHSIFEEIIFADAENDDFTVTNLQAWRPFIKVDGFGASRTAITTDMNGKAFNNVIGAFADNRGVFMTRATGDFTVKGADVYCSLGVYDKDNKLVLWLFNMLPLKPGTYSYWMPATDMFGNKLNAGEYTVKLTESNLKLRFITAAGNDAADPTKRPNYAALGVDRAIFDSKSRPVLILNWSESYEQVRGMNADLTSQNWSIPGSSTAYGGAYDNMGYVYLLRENDRDTYILQKIDEDKGTILEDTPNQYGVVINKSDAPDADGIAFLNGKVYIASKSANKLYNGYNLEDYIDTIGSPSLPVTDFERGLLWYVSDNKNIIAVNENKETVVTFETGFDAVVSVGVNGTRMVIADAELGQLIRYDITDYNNPKEIGRIGSGDGPYGKMTMDRFEFQSFNGEKSGKGRVFIANDGKIIVTEPGGVKMFTWDGTPLRKFNGLWSQYITMGANTSGSNLHELVDVVTQRTVVFDDKTETAEWGANYRPAIMSNKLGLMHDTVHFMYDGVRYSYSAGQHYDNDGKHVGGILLLNSYKNSYSGEIIWGLANFNSIWHERFDFSNGYTYDVNDWTPVVKSDGTNIGGGVPDVLIHTYTPEAFMSAGNRVYHIPVAEFADSHPKYDWDNVKIIDFKNGTPNGQLISPYDLTTSERPSAGRYVSRFEDGTYVGNPSFKTGNNTGFANWGGSSLGGYSADGTLRWLLPTTYPDNQGVKVVGNIGYSVSVPLQQFSVVNSDGALIGVLGTPKGIYWNGMWLDNSFQYLAFEGTEGRHYVVIGNFNDSVMWVCEVLGVSDVNVTESKLTLTDEWVNSWGENPTPRTDILWHRPPNATTKIVIKKLDSEMVIDGELNKWRELLPTPQVIVTPETGTGIDGPKDASALIRFAYTQGEDDKGNLYVQFIRFDNIIAFHQPAEKFYKQDALEMAINSFLDGVKINVARSSDYGDIVVRDGWFLPVKRLPEELAPRKITIYDDASQISERKLLEDIYGIDMSDCKVVVMEFMIALDEDTFEGRLEAMPKVKSGETFHLGLGVDDNDSPGADLQKMFVWPATYGTFANKNVSALVVFE